MKKSVWISASLIMVIAMATFMLAQATPTGQDNNPLAEIWHVSFATNYAKYIIFGTHEYFPSIDNVNKLVITTVEPKPLYYTLTVGAHIYKMGIDFAYSGIFEKIFFDPVFDNPKLGMLYPSSYRSTQERVTYTYDFSAYAGGIEGTLQLQKLETPAGSFITSISGTGDLANVNVQGTTTSQFNPVNFVLTVQHDGTVIGWPE